MHPSLWFLFLFPRFFGLSALDLLWNFHQSKVLSLSILRPYIFEFFMFVTATFSSFLFVRYRFAGAYFVSAGFMFNFSVFLPVFCYFSVIFIVCCWLATVFFFLANVFFFDKMLGFSYFFNFFSLILGRVRKKEEEKNGKAFDIDIDLKLLCALVEFHKSFIIFVCCLS